MSYLCNMSICNRVYLGTIIEKYINKNLHIDSISLKWDTIHDSIKEEKLITKIKYYIVMGLHQFTTTPISRNI